MREKEKEKKHREIPGLVRKVGSLVTPGCMGGGRGGDEFPHMCMASIISSNDPNSGAYVSWVHLCKTC